MNRKSGAYANKFCFQREVERNHRKHRRNLRNMKSLARHCEPFKRVGIDFSPPATLNMLKKRGRQRKLEQDRKEEIDRQNDMLLKKIRGIMQSKQRSGFVEFAPGYRLNSAQQPTLDNYISPGSLYPGQAMALGSIGEERRRWEEHTRALENVAMLRRINAQKASRVVDTKLLRKSRKEAEGYIRCHTNFRPTVTHSSPAGRTRRQRRGRPQTSRFSQRGDPGLPSDAPVLPAALAQSLSPKKSRRRRRGGRGARARPRTSGGRTTTTRRAQLRAPSGSPTRGDAVARGDARIDDDGDAEVASPLASPSSSQQQTTTGAAALDVDGVYRSWRLIDGRPMLITSRVDGEAAVGFNAMDVATGKTFLAALPMAHLPFYVPGLVLARWMKSKQADTSSHRFQLPRRRKHVPAATAGTAEASLFACLERLLCFPGAAAASGKAGSTRSGVGSGLGFALPNYGIAKLTQAVEQKQGRQATQGTGGGGGGSTSNTEIGNTGEDAALSFSFARGERAMLCRMARIRIAPRQPGFGLSLDAEKHGTGSGDGDDPRTRQLLSGLPGGDDPEKTRTPTTSSLPPGLNPGDQQAGQTRREAAAAAAAGEVTVANDARPLKAFPAVVSVDVRRGHLALAALDLREEAKVAAARPLSSSSSSSSFAPALAYRVYQCEHRVRVQRSVLADGRLDDVIRHLVKCLILRVIGPPSAPLAVLSLDLSAAERKPRMLSDAGGSNKDDWRYLAAGMTPPPAAAATDAAAALTLPTV